MKNLTLENITKVCGGVYFGPADKLDQEVSSITTDSRKIEAALFSFQLWESVWMRINLFLR